MIQVQHYLNVTAMCIGYFVMAAWVIGIAWLLSVLIGEIRFNFILRRYQRLDSESPTSSWDPEPERQWDAAGSNDGDTTILPRLPLLQEPRTNDIRFRFHPDEDDFPTEQTGSVFDIRERYPNEFA